MCFLTFFFTGTVQHSAYALFIFENVRFIYYRFCVLMLTSKKLCMRKGRSSTGLGGTAADFICIIGTGKLYCRDLSHIPLMATPSRLLSVPMLCSSQQPDLHCFVCKISLYTYHCAKIQKTTKKLRFAHYTCAAGKLNSLGRWVQWEAAQSPFSPSSCPFCSCFLSAFL